MILGELTRFNERGKNSRRKGEIGDDIPEKLRLISVAIGVLVSSFVWKEQSRHFVHAIGRGKWAVELDCNFGSFGLWSKQA